MYFILISLLLLSIKPNLAINSSTFQNYGRRGSPCAGSSEQVDVRQKPSYLYSPGFPYHFYPRDSICQWELTSPLGTKIHIVSQLFSLEESASCVFDSLSVYDVPPQQATVEARYCGNDRIDIITSNNKAYLILVTDWSYEDRGFNISYFATKMQSSGIKNFGVSCNKTILTARQNLLSPDYPLTYISNARCYYSIRSPASFTIQLIFKQFMLEEDDGCSNDYLEVYDGPDKNSRLLGRYCGDKHPTYLMSSSSEMFVYFRSDEFYERSGFNISFKFLSPDDRFAVELGEKSDALSSGDEDCSGIIRSRAGELTTPGYPMDYLPQKRCITILRASPGYFINLTFTRFVLEESLGCVYDWLRILNGEDKDSPLLGRFCGDFLNNQTITSADRFLRLEFQSDTSVQHNGYSATYRFIKKSQECPLKCHNYGNCVEDENGPHCECPVGYGGTVCSKTLKSCVDRPCLNKGKCFSNKLAYRCQCPDTFVGHHCETVVGLNFTVLPANITATVGKTYFLECGANKDADISWTYEDVILDKDDDVTNSMGIDIYDGGVILVKSFSMARAGKYTCTARRGGESVLASGWLISPKPCPPLIRRYPSNSTVLQGDNHHLECVAQKLLHIVSWKKDDFPVLPQSRIKVLVNGMLSIESVKLSDGGKYTCEVRDNSGCIKRHSAWLKVRRHDNLNEECGRALKVETRKGRITKGIEAVDGAHPWFVLLRNPKTHIQSAKTFCGGSLISQRWIVSAAHCIRSFGQGRDTPIFSKEHTRIYIGTNECDGKGGIEAEISRVIIHPKFDINTFDYDIALIKLSRPVKFTPKIVPICLRNHAYIKAQLLRPQNYGDVVGCGSEIESGHGAKRLMHVRVPIQSHSRCTLSTKSRVTKTMICAGYSRATRGDSCQGDSGGPYVMKDDQGISVLVGIVSWGEGCDRKDKFGFYTNTGMLYDWINEKLAEDGGR